jgi:hypothetical protein
MTLANGQLLMLETDQGQLQWQRDNSRLTLRANSVRLLDMKGNEIAKLGDVMLERKSSDKGVRVNLASRPQMAGGEGVVSGQLVMPTQSFTNVVNLFGGDSLPTIGMMLNGIMDGLMKSGGTLKVENVSFRAPGKGGATGGISGAVQVLADGRMVGKMAVTTDSAARVLGWIRQAGLLAPRTNTEALGVARFSNGLVAARATVRMENMQSMLMLNGQPVGPLPMAKAVVSRLWL